MSWHTLYDLIYVLVLLKFSFWTVHLLKQKESGSFFLWISPLNSDVCRITENNIKFILPYIHGTMLHNLMLFVVQALDSFHSVFFLLKKKKERKFLTKFVSFRRPRRWKLHNRVDCNNKSMWECKSLLFFVIPLVVVVVLYFCLNIVIKS